MTQLRELVNVLRTNNSEAFTVVANLRAMFLSVQSIVAGLFLFVARLHTIIRGAHAIITSLFLFVVWAHTMSLCIHVIFSEVARIFLYVILFVEGVDRTIDAIHTMFWK